MEPVTYISRSNLLGVKHFFQMPLAALPCIYSPSKPLCFIGRCFSSVQSAVWVQSISSMLLPHLIAGVYLSSLRCLFNLREAKILFLSYHFLTPESLFLKLFPSKIYFISVQGHLSRPPGISSITSWFLSHIYTSFTIFPLFLCSLSSFLIKYLSVTFPTDHSSRPSSNNPSQWFTLPLPSHSSP